MKAPVIHCERDFALLTRQSASHSLVEIIDAAQSESSRLFFLHRESDMIFFANIFLCLLLVKDACGQFYNERLLEFIQIFSSCRRSDTKYFDVCMLRALNDAREFFETGVPEFNVAPFDPFYAHEVTQKRGLPAFNYKLILRNVFESGWVNSEVTEFKSDLKDGYIRYRQYFPEKFLHGGWQMYNNFLTPYSNSGTFDLSLYNYTQVTTIRRSRNVSDPENPFSVKVKAMECDDLKLHINNLLKGRKTLEKMLDRLINFGWRPGFKLMKPLIDDLVSTAFTKIFNDDFRHFPFDAVIPR